MLSCLTYSALIWERWTLPGGVAKSLVQITLSKSKSSIKLNGLIAEQSSFEVIFKQKLEKDFALDGVDVNASTTIRRDQMLETIELTLKEARLIVISSPPATGKTALMMLLVNKYPSAEFGYIQFTPEANAKQVFDSTLSSFKGPDGVIIIDDAQNKYEDEEFWLYLVKGFIASHPQYKFIICATHTLGIYKASPVVLVSYPHIYAVTICFYLTRKLRISSSDPLTTMK